jgi:hypothetical protein
VCGEINSSHRDDTLGRVVTTEYQRTTSNNANPKKTFAHRYNAWG